MVWLGVAAGELIGLIVLAGLLVRSRREVARLRASAARAPLTGARLVAGRAVSAVNAVVETAVRVRERGVGGLLMSSLEDLNRWAAEDRAEIARVAGPEGTVTIFFSDIEDSTTLNERLGDTQWVRLLDAHERLVRGHVDRHRGHVVKSQGDGFMVVFGDTAAAVRAATGIQTELRDGPARRLRRTPIRIRFGIHVGAVVSRGGDYFGRNVAMTARIAALAVGGEILVSDDVRAALQEVDGDDVFVLEPRGDVELKGLTDVHALWAVNWSAQ